MYLTSSKILGLKILLNVTIVERALSLRNVSDMENDIVSALVCTIHVRLFITFISKFKSAMSHTGSTISADKSLFKRVTPLRNILYMKNCILNAVCVQFLPYCYEMVNMRNLSNKLKTSTICKRIMWL